MGTAREARKKITDEAAFASSAMYDRLLSVESSCQIRHRKKGEYSPSR
jgi:hypothetical protein